MSVGSIDYVIYKLRTFEPDSHVSSCDLHVFINAVFVHTDNSLMITAASSVVFFLQSQSIFTSISHMNYCGDLPLSL